MKCGIHYDIHCDKVWHTNCGIHCDKVWHTLQQSVTYTSCDKVWHALRKSVTYTVTKYGIHCGTVYDTGPPGLWINKMESYFEGFITI